jgi:hypothetical protein
MERLIAEFRNIQNLNLHNSLWLEMLTWYFSYTRLLEFKDPFTLKTEAVVFSETLLDIHDVTKFHSSDDHSLTYVIRARHDFYSSCADLADFPPLPPLIGQNFLLFKYKYHQRQMFESRYEPL